MTTEELRSFLLVHLASIKDEGRCQWNDCVRNVSDLLRRELNKSHDPNWEIPRADMNRLKHVVWDLIIDRILIPGTPNSDSGWPFLSLTDHGLKVVGERHPVPYDPDGYLARLEKATGGLSPTIHRYLQEAVSTFRSSNYLASAVMLGAASEMLFIEVCTAISGAIQDTQSRANFGKRTAPKCNMVERVRAVTEWLSQNKNQLPDEWRTQERPLLINKIADLIRDRRNEAGHPQDPPAARSHEEMYALLMVFPDYCIKLYSVKTWLDAHPDTIV